MLKRQNSELRFSGFVADGRERQTTMGWWLVVRCIRTYVSYVRLFLAQSHRKGSRGFFSCRHAKALNFHKIPSTVLPGARALSGLTRPFGVLVS